MIRKTLLLSSLILLLSACTGSAPSAPSPTTTPTATRVPPTSTFTPLPPSATATERVPTQAPPTPTSTPIYTVSTFTCPQALPTRLGQGVIARVTYAAGAALRIRVSPRFTDANIFDLVAEGGYVDILEGPVCVFDAEGTAYVFWKIRDREADITGWAAESDSDIYYLEYNYPPRPLRNDTTLITAYEEALGIMLDPALTIPEKRARLLVFQRTYGEEVLLQIIEYVPVYDDGLNYFHNFDAYIRGLISPYGAWSTDSPYARDPIAAGLSIFFDPSEENIRQQMGLN